MNKTLKLYIAVWGILLVAFNVTVFVCPTVIAGYDKFGGAFWSGYLFITLALLCHVACAFLAFKEENINKLFYNVSIVLVSRVGLILTFIVGTACMVIPNVPNFIGIILCFAIFAFTAIAVAKASFAADAVEERGAKVKAQTFFIKSLTVDAENLIAQAKSEAVKTECKKVYEAVRYSDPMSNDALASVEGHITIKFAELSEAVDADDVEKVTAIANDVVILVGDRNKKCRLLK